MIFFKLVIYLMIYVFGHLNHHNWQFPIVFSRHIMSFVYIAECIVYFYAILWRNKKMWCLTFSMSLLSLFSLYQAIHILLLLNGILQVHDIILNIWCARTWNFWSDFHILLYFGLIKRQYIQNRETWEECPMVESKRQYIR